VPIVYVHTVAMHAWSCVVLRCFMYCPVAVFKLNDLFALLLFTVSYMYLSYLYSGDNVAFYIYNTFYLAGYSVHLVSVFTVVHGSSPAKSSCS